MKFCAQCGAKNEDEAAFCQSCGQPLGGAETQVLHPSMLEAYNQSAQSDATSMPEPMLNSTPVQMQVGNQSDIPKKGLSKKMKIIIGIIAAICVVVGVGGYIAYNNIKKRVDVNKYVEVQISGYNEAGKAEIKLNKSDFYHAILKAQGYNLKKMADADISRLERKVADSLADCGFAMQLDKESHISNGESVKLMINIPVTVKQKMGITLVSKESSYKVDGLDQAKLIDPFEYVSVDFDGVSPKVKVKLSNTATNSDDSFLKKLSFTADKTSNIASGDKITVRVKTDEPEALENGYRFNQTEKQYECNKVDEYVQKISDISDSNLDVLKKDAKDKVTSYITGINSDYGVTYSDLQYEGVYFLKQNSGNNNYACVVYSANVSAKPRTNSSYRTFSATKVYFPVYMSGILIKGNGSITHDSSLSIRGTTSLRYGNSSSLSGYTSGETMYNEIIKNNKSKYTCEVIGNISSFGG